jgi:hypothetical protein
MRVKIIGLGSELFFSICSRWHLGDTMVTLEKHPKGKKTLSISSLHFLRVI